MARLLSPRARGARTRSTLGESPHRRPALAFPSEPSYHGFVRPPTSNDPVVAELVRRLTEAYRPERIYLFGLIA